MIAASKRRKSHFMGRRNVIQRMDRVHVVTRLIFQTQRSAEAPNPKSQVPNPPVGRIRPMANKSQAPTTKKMRANRSPWSLGFGTSLELGAWSLELGAWSLELGAW